MSVAPATRSSGDPSPSTSATAIESAPARNWVCRPGHTRSSWSDPETRRCGAVPVDPHLVAARRTGSRGGRRRRGRRAAPAMRRASAGGRDRARSRPRRCRRGGPDRRTSRCPAGTPCAGSRRPGPACPAQARRPSPAPRQRRRSTRPPPSHRRTAGHRAGGTPAAAAAGPRCGDRSMRSSAAGRGGRRRRGRSQPRRTRRWSAAPSARR